MTELHFVYAMETETLSSFSYWADLPEFWNITDSKHHVVNISLHLKGREVLLLE